MKKIFFSASTYSIPEMLENYLAILSEVKKNGGFVLSDWTKDWIDIAKKYREKNKMIIKGADMFKIIDRKKFFEIHSKMIRECDAIIAEVTRPSTSVGYQLFYAMSHKKPALVLYYGDAPNLDIEAIKTVVNTDSPKIFFKKYNKNSLPNTIRSFFRKQDDVLKKFNFLITEEIEKYVKWLVQKNSGKSRSELLRGKIIEEIIINDKEYQKYLDRL